LPNLPETNPNGQATGNRKVVRGTDINDVQQTLDPSASPDYKANYLHLLSVHNRSFGPVDPYAQLNFRCVINSDKPLPKQ
jgi:hypothetical protein